MTISITFENESPVGLIQDMELFIAQAKQSSLPAQAQVTPPEGKPTDETASKVRATMKKRKEARALGEKGEPLPQDWETNETLQEDWQTGYAVFEDASDVDNDEQGGSEEDNTQEAKPQKEEAPEKTPETAPEGVTGDVSKDDLTGMIEDCIAKLGTPQTKEIMMSVTGDFKTAAKMDDNERKEVYTKLLAAWKEA